MMSRWLLSQRAKYVGEVFDMPRLDTLFLTMPISWTGTVQQYAGRLHRLFDGKNEVQIYDYVDVHVSQLEGMHQKCLKSYASIGYKVKDTASSIEQIHSIYNDKTFFPVYGTDILSAKTEIVIVSPFLMQRSIISVLPRLSASNANVTVITNSPEDYPDKKAAQIKSCIAMLENAGITVKTKSRIHQKFAVIDQRLVWYGSVNLLSYGSSEESIMRIESVDIASELLRGILS
jgi:superfamily II DNA or RNA helicase